MQKFVLMGVQGSGKGTQATLLEERFDLVHISVGDILRWNIQHHTKLGAQVKRTTATGQLVSDDLIDEVVHDRLQLHDWNYGFVVDGFPRTAPQAEFFLERYDIDGVVILDLPDAEVERRVLSRRVCAGCGLDYNLIAHRPRVADTCDVCGGRLVSRSDDHRDALAARLAEYYARTEPVVEIFRRKERVARIDAAHPVEEVFTAICDALGLPHGG